MANRADFAPELGALKTLRPFVFWAQTTLPTVFDDSLSYYEVLTKLCKMVNTMLENEDTNAENIAALAEAYQELEDFTNNYFENLDVTQEINDKLDALVADGTIGGYVIERATTLVNTYLYGEDGESGKNKEINDMISEAQTDIEEALTNFATRSNQAVTTFELNSAAAIGTFQGRVDEQIAGVSTIVKDWMDDNFTNPSSVVIDDTLTVKDAAAEAYATGKLMDDATNMVLATSYWQDYVVDSVSGSFILADVSGGSNPAVGTGAPSKTLYIANVTPGETYIVSGVASSYSTTRYTPAYALGNLTYDANDNPHYEFYDVYPRGWDVSQDPGTVYQYVRNQTVRIPTGTTPTVTHLFIVGDSRVPITVKCARLNARTDTALTSETLPAQGKATGDALDTKIPWPVTSGSKDVGTAGKRLASNGDGTTSWADESGDYDEEIENLQNDVADLKSSLETFEDGFANLNLWYKAELLYTDRYADVAPNTGKVIYRENAYNIGSWLLEVDGTKTYTSSQPMRTLVPLQEDKETATTPTNVALANVYSIDLNNYPNTKYLAISLEGITSTVISVGTTAQNGTVYPTWLYEFNHGKRPSYNATYSSITSGSSVGLPVSNCLRKNSRLMFVAEISSYGELEIGYATGENGTGVKYNRFIIRKNAIVPYTYYDYSASAMHQDDNVQHNLAITSGNVEVVIEELPDAKCRLTIGNNGNSFVHTFDGWVRNNRLSPYITANWSIFGKSFFSWTCTDLSKGVWLLGDSYMAYEPERWAYYLEQNGYADNVLISSFPGAWSSTNIASFEVLLKYGTPKYAVWAMGMNDGGDSDSAPSNSWVTGRDNFLALCANNHITPIFCTIPTVPTVNNEQKNAWVRASGYRYIDFAKAVLATSSGAWGTGMLSGDGVHPTANGAKALYYQALTDFPEIMLA